MSSAISSTESVLSQDKNLSHDLMALLTPKVALSCYFSPLQIYCMMLRQVIDVQTIIDGFLSLDECIYED